MRTAANPVRLHPGQSIALLALAGAGVAYVCLLAVLGAERAGVAGGLLLTTAALLGCALGVAVAALFERSWRLLPEAWGQRASLLFVASLPLCWAGFVFLPPMAMESGLVAGGLATTLGLCAIAALPAVLLGTALAVSTVDAARASARCASQRLGAAVGCVLVPMLLAETGAGGLLLATAALGLAAAMASAPMESFGRTAVVVLAVGAGFAMHSVDAHLPVPGLREAIDLGPVAVDPSLPASRWNCGGRVEVAPLRSLVVAVPAAPNGESMDVHGPRPTATVRRWWIATRGRRGAELVDRSGANGPAAPIGTHWRTLGVQLGIGPRGKACVLGLGGGEELWALRQTEASVLRVVEPDAAVSQLHERLLGTASPVHGDPRIELVHDGLRASLQRTDERFDLVVHNAPLPPDGDEAPNGGDLERYQLFTVEAFRAVLDRLVDGGLVQWSFRGDAQRAMRMLYALYASLPEEQRASFPSSVAVLHDAADDVMVVLYEKGGFDEDEAVRLRDLARAATVDAVALPDGGLRAEVEQRRAELAELDAEAKRLEHEISIRTVGADDAEIARLTNELGKVMAPRPALQLRCDLAEFVLAESKSDFAESHGMPTRPATDDRPFASPLVERSFGGTRYLLAVVSAAGLALFLAMLPLLWRGGAVGTSRQGALRYLLAFACLGFAVVAVAMGLLQKFLPLLGGPGEAIAAVLGSFLLAAALGAVSSHPLLNWEPQRGRYVAIAGLVACGLAAFASPFVIDLCSGLGTLGRLVAVAALAGPIGLCLGMAVPHGLRVLDGDNPDLVAFAHVVAAASAAASPLVVVLLAGQVGFSLVLLLAGAATSLALLLLDGPAQRVAPQASAEGEAVEGEVAEAEAN